MKTSISAVIAWLLLAATTLALPRLVVSTPSLAPESEIDLILDFPVTEVSQLGKTTENTWLDIQPPLPGKLLWKAQNIARFVPDIAPVIGMTYSFSIPKGRKHLDGTEIPAGKVTQLVSEPFRILSASPINRWSSDYSASTAQWLVVLNDETDPAAAAAFFSFISKTSQRVAASLRPATYDEAGYLATSNKPWSARFRSAADAEAPAAESATPHVLIASPLSPLPVGEGWALSVLKGLPNKTASARLIEDSSYQIGNIDPFKAMDVDEYVSADQPRKIILRFNQPVATELPTNFLTASLHINPRPENLTAEVHGREIHLGGDLDANDRYTVAIRPPLISRDGLPMQGPFNKNIQFERLSPELILPSTHEAQLASGGRTYTIQTVNLASIRVRLKKSNGADFIRTYQGYSHYTGSGTNGRLIEPTAPLPSPLIVGETILDKEIVLGNAIDTSKEVTLDWNKLLPADLRHAAMFLDITGIPHAGTGREGRRSAQALIQLTDIGLAWKLTAKEAFIYAFSCESGKPLQGVKIQLFGEDASALDSVSTDASGLAKLPRPEAATHLHASLGTDAYVTAYDSRLSTVGLWHFPVRYSWNTPPESVRRAFIFTDRSLYRPGETVRLKGVVRTQRGNLIEPATEGQARIAIIDPASKEIHTSDLTISNTGSFDLTYTLPNAKTGTHVIRLEYPEEIARAEATEDWEIQHNLMESARFEHLIHVEEFRRNAFEIKSKVAAVEPGAARVEFQLAAKYYQGQPVAAGKVSHLTRVNPRNPYPERFRDYLFGNHRIDDWGYWYHYFGYRDENGRGDQAIQNQAEAQLLADGTVSLPVEIPQSDFPTAREVTLSAEITDANNQTLTSTTSTTIHPASIYIGISRNDKLIRAGKPVGFTLVATDTEGEPFKESVSVTATLTREVNTAVKSMNAEGETTTRNDASEETITTAEYTIPAAASAGQGHPIEFLPQQNGLHFLTIRGTDSQGRAFSTVTRFHVYGTNEYPWLYEDGLRVKLVAEKKSYRPGETARVLVLSPIEGTALVTVERENVLRSFLTELKADNPVIEIPLTDADAPNAYVSVLIVKGSGESAREHKEPQLRLGYCELTVENLRDTLAVKIDDTSASHRPGDEVVLTGAITLADGSPAAAAEVTLYAEDEGTLAVMGYTTPDPMKHFYDPRLLAVEAGTSFHTFLSEDPDMRSFFNKGFNIGGGADLGKLEDQARKNFDPCATWAPSLVTDAQGRFSHTFRLPDTLTRYRVIAVAHQGAARFGHAESSLLVRKEIMLEPMAPRFANEGDTFSPQVLVQNASSHSGTWNITCESGDGTGTPLLRLLGESTQSVTLTAGASATVVFPVTATSTGEAVLVWKATPASLEGTSLTPVLARNLSDNVETRLPVHYPMPLIRQVALTRFTGNKDLKELLDPQILNGNGSVELEFARSPLVDAAGSIHYLLSYPHGCLEQTTSSLMPWLAVENLRSHIPSFAKVTDQEIRAAIQAGADRLLSMQRPDGSFSYWPGSADTVDWATPYAALGLVIAVEQGAQIPQSATDLLTQYLTASLRGIAEVKSPAVLEIHARSLLALAIAKSPQPSYQNLLRDRLPELTPAARALLATAICYSADGDARAFATARGILSSKVAFPAPENTWSPGNAAAPLELMAWVAIDPNAPETTKALDRLLRDRNPYGHWNTTWVNGWSLMAMAAYAGELDISDETIAIEILTNDGSETIHLNADQSTAVRTIALGPNTKLELNSNRPAHVRLHAAVKPAIAPVQPVATNGLSVDRIYERILADGSAEILTEPSVGDLIRVTLRVTLPNDDTRYLVVEDLLPSIFETVNSGFSSQRAIAAGRTSENDWNVSHSELRDDRAVFYLDHIYRRGTYTLNYLARCTVAGQSLAPSAKVESMYDPANFALSASRKFSTR